MIDIAEQLKATGVVLLNGRERTQTQHAHGKFRRVKAKLNKTVYLSLTPIFVLWCWQ
jgi:hypothetical protein